MSEDSQAATFDLEAVQAMMDTGFEANIGLVVDEVDGHVLRAHFEAGPQHHQPYGIVHGGVYAAIVEAMGSVAGARAAHPQVVVGVNNSTDFLRSHRIGRLDVVARPIHIGRSQHLWEVAITRPADDKLVARGQLRLQTLPQPPESKETSDEA